MSFKIDFEITDDMIADVKRVLSKYYCLEVNDDFVEKVVRSDFDFAQDLFQSDGCGDTITRERAIDAVCEMLLGEGKSWPCNFHKESEVQAFYKDLKESCHKNNLKFDIDL